MQNDRLKHKQQCKQLQVLNYNCNMVINTTENYIIGIKLFTVRNILKVLKK